MVQANSHLLPKQVEQLQDDDDHHDLSTMVNQQRIHDADSLHQLQKASDPDHKPHDTRHHELSVLCTNAEELRVTLVPSECTSHNLIDGIHSKGQDSRYKRIVQIHGSLLDYTNQQRPFTLGQDDRFLISIGF